MPDKPEDASDKPAGTSSGDDAPSMDVLARRYLDLWQDQMARMADDPATTDMLARTFTLLTRSAQAYAAAGAPADGSSPDNDVSSDSQNGAASAAPVSGSGGGQLSDLLDRIDALEKRVADLERGGGPAHPPTRPARPAPSTKRRLR